MATPRQVERFFEGTGLSVESVELGRDGAISLIGQDGTQLVISCSVRANRTGDINQPALTADIASRKGK